MSPQFSRHQFSISSRFYQMLLSRRSQFSHWSINPPACFLNFFKTILVAPITINMAVTAEIFIQHLIVLSIYFVVCRNSDVRWHKHFFWFTATWPGFLASIRRSICISKSHQSLCFILSERFWFVHIPMSFIDRLHSSQEITYTLSSLFSLG